MTAVNGFVSVRRMQIEWGHCDAAHIVFNPRFFEFFDWSTSVLLQTALNLSLPNIINTYRAGTPLVETRATFHAPARMGDNVEIRSMVVEIGRTSFMVEHRMTRDGLLLVEGREKRVWVSTEPGPDGRLMPLPLPEDVIARLRGSAPG